MSLAREIYDDVYHYEDILSWDERERWELIDGKAYQMAAPSVRHQRVSRNLFRAIDAYFRDKTCEAFYAPFDVKLFAKKEDTPDKINTVVQPDIVIVCDSEKLDRTGCRGAPDWIIEILSDSTGRRDRREKYGLYEKAGVREYWIVDPDMKVILAHNLENGKYHAPKAYAMTIKARVSPSIFPECVIDMTDVFENI